MRRPLQRRMIGSLLFYALYPLSRYLRGRLAEALKKTCPPAALNGSAGCDGAAVTPKNFPQSEAAPLAQRLSTGSGPRGDMEDATEPGVDTDPPTAVLHEDAAPPAFPTTTDESHGVSRDEAERMHEPSQEGGATPSICEATEDGRGPPNADLDPEQAVLTLLKCMQSKDGLQETTCTLQNENQTISFEEDAAKTEGNASQIKGQIQLQATAETGLTECWDEYVLAGAVQTNDNHVNSPTMPFPATGWHFSAGPGLEGEVRCPLWEFPAASYYPSLDTAAPLEVVWRAWEDLSGDAAAAGPDLTPFPFEKAWFDFTIMSYNILAQDLLEANPDLYTHCPLEVLDWSYRCSVLLGEIQKWLPDILCLQEVQENHYEEDLHPALSQMGYTCAFKRRTGTKTDGCATCHRSDRFSEVAATQLEFFRPETGLLDRHNVGVVSLLRPALAPGRGGRGGRRPPLCVANTHLLFNPRRGDVKLAQAAIVLAEIDRAVRSCEAGGERCGVILCGDFNSVPHSALYQLLTTGGLFYQHLPLWMVSYQEDLSYKMNCPRLAAPLWPSSLGITDTCQYFPKETLPESQSQNSGKHRYSHEFMLTLRYCPAACARPSDLTLIPGVTDNAPDPSSGNQPYDKRVTRFRHTLSHGLDLESVYKHTLPGSGHPEVTTLHSETGATVDYIFYSPERPAAAAAAAASQQKAAVAGGGLQLTGCLSLLSEDVLWSMHGLPNHVFPSDHLSLLARFRLDVSPA